MQLYYVPAARPRVQAVHVLGYEGKLRDVALELRQRLMSRVRRGLPHEIAPPLIPLPHEAGVSGESLRGRELLRVVALPEPGLRLAERWHPALDRDAGAGQHDDALGVAEGPDEARR